jgi:hypothetical protein
VKVTNTLNKAGRTATRHCESGVGQQRQLHIAGADGYSLKSISSEENYSGRIYDNVLWAI